MVNEFGKDFGRAIFRGKDRIFSYVACELFIYILFQFFPNIKSNLHCFFREFTDSNAVLDGKFVTVGASYSVFPKTLNYVLKLYFRHEDDIFVFVIESGISVHVAGS